MNRIPEILVWLILAGAAAAQTLEGAQPTVVDPGGPGNAPSDAIVLFDGKDNSHWMTMDGKPSKCTVADGVMICRTGAGDSQSTEKFRDARTHVEFNLPYEPAMQGPGRANSGAILMGRYEIQILDSYQNPTYANGSCGSLYGQSAPLVNASRRPGEWQTYDIICHAPHWAADGTVETPGSLTRLHNGVRVQDHVSVRAGAASFESDAGRHIINFLSCIKSRQRPVYDIEIGAFSTIPALMAAFPFEVVVRRSPEVGTAPS